jgi:rhodanese-related sulfurtransferase
MFPIKEIDVGKLLEKIEQGGDDIELIDIRTPAEVARGVLPNAKTLPMHLIPLKIGHFADPGKEYIIYCRTGSRSAQACMFLNQQGINNVYNLRGGIMSWAQHGLNIEPTPAGSIQ